MTVSVGLVGLGLMGTTHLSAYERIPGARLVALCDRDAKRLERDRALPAGNLDAGADPDADRAGARTFGELTDLLAGASVDAVDLCVPTDLHAEMAVAALEAGKHVFCEKPMALTAADARRMADAARASGRFLMVGHVLRFWPEYLWMKEALDSGRHGPLRSAVFWRWGGWPAWGEQSWFAETARSGGAAMDLHVHDADVVQWFFGTPEQVTSHGTVASDGGVDTLWTRYRCDGGALVVAEGGWLPGGYPFSMGATLAFESATIEYHSDKHPTLSVFGEGSAVERPEIAETNAYADELAYFIHCVAAGEEPRRAGAPDAARAVALVEAEVQSVKTDQPVAL